MSAQIIYTDIIPDTTYSCGYPPPWGSCSNYYNIDINNDGTMDFKFYYSKDNNQYMSHQYDYISPYNSNTIIDSGLLCYPIHPGDTIDSSNNWGTGGTFYSYSYLSGGSSQTSGIWPYNSNDYFVGLRLVVGSNIYYGWIRKRIYTLIDFAYELSGNYIIAGQLPVNVGIFNNKEKNLQFDLSPNPATTTLTIVGVTGSTIAEIFDISGKLLLSKQLNTNQIDISSLAKGLYFIKLSTAEGSVVRKFVKN